MLIFLVTRKDKIASWYWQLSLFALLTTSHESRMEGIHNSYNQFSKVSYKVPLIIPNSVKEIGTLYSVGIHRQLYCLTFLVLFVSSPWNYGQSYQKRSTYSYQNEYKFDIWCEASLVRSSGSLFSSIKGLNCKPILVFSQMLSILSIQLIRAWN